MDLVIAVTACVGLAQAAPALTTCDVNTDCDATDVSPSNTVHDVIVGGLMAGFILGAFVMYRCRTTFGTILKTIWLRTRHSNVLCETMVVLKHGVERCKNYVPTTLVDLALSYILQWSFPTPRPSAHAEPLYPMAEMRRSVEHDGLFRLEVSTNSVLSLNSEQTQLVESPICESFHTHEVRTKFEREAQAFVHRHFTYPFQVVGGPQAIQTTTSPGIGRLGRKARSTTVPIPATALLARPSAMPVAVAAS